MRVAEKFSYRHAEAILEKVYPNEKSEIEAAIGAAAWKMKSAPKTRSRGGRVVATLDVYQVKTNEALSAQFLKHGWTSKPLIVSTSESRLVADFKKSKIQVEVQFGNAARYYADIFKFLLSYSADDIEVGVLVVGMECRAKRMDENLACYERVVRELPHAKLGITLPVWVLGVD